MPKIAISVNHNRQLHTLILTHAHTEQSTLGFTERQQQLPQSKNHSSEEKKTFKCRTLEGNHLRKEKKYLNGSNNKCQCKYIYETHKHTHTHTRTHFIHQPLWESYLPPSPPTAETGNRK